MTDMFPKAVAYNRLAELERTVVIQFILFVGEMHRDQLCRQHPAKRMQEPADSYAQYF